MDSKLVALYRKCRAEKPFMHSGRDAECSLRAARTILEFRRAEADGLVRLRAEPENESYLDVFGKPEAYTNTHGRRVSAEQALKELLETLERNGVWWSCSEWFDGEDWQQADSCGMHAGYSDPLDPFENCYIVDHMRSALDALTTHRETVLQTQLAEVFP